MEIRKITRTTTVLIYLTAGEIGDLECRGAAATNARRIGVVTGKTPRIPTYRPDQAVVVLRSSEAEPETRVVSVEVRGQRVLADGSEGSTRHVEVYRNGKARFWPPVVDRLAEAVIDTPAVGAVAP